MVVGSNVDFRKPPQFLHVFGEIKVASRHI